MACNPLARGDSQAMQAFQEAAAILKLKICLVGDEAVGKTSVIRRFVNNQFNEDYMRTIGTLISKKDVHLFLNDARPVDASLVLWDIMGQKNFMELLKDAYFYKANGILAVCDVTRPSTLPTLKEWIRASENAAGKLPVVFMANKLDLISPDARHFEDLEQAARQYGGSYHLTSAKTGQGVEAAFNDLARRVAEIRLGPKKI